jgi:hypothetical protein
MKVGTLGWDYNEFINRSSKGDPLSQKEKKWLVQVEFKMVHKQTTTSQTHKTHHDLNLEKNHHLFFHSILCD